MLTELIELSCKMKEEMKATQSEINMQGKIYREPTIKERNSEFKSMIWNKGKK